MANDVRHDGSLAYYAKGTIGLCYRDLPAVVFNLVTVNADRDIIDIHYLVLATALRLRSVASRTNHVDFDIVDILQLVFVISTLVTIGLIVLIRVNIFLTTHALHLPHPIRFISRDSVCSLGRC